MLVDLSIRASWCWGRRRRPPYLPYSTPLWNRFGAAVAILTGSGGKCLFHRIGWKGRIWKLWNYNDNNDNNNDNNNDTNSNSHYLYVDNNYDTAPRDLNQTTQHIQTTQIERKTNMCIYIYIITQLYTYIYIYIHTLLQNQQKRSPEGSSQLHPAEGGWT